MIKGMSDLPASTHHISAMPSDSPDHTLKQGLAALQATDYPRAIQCFAALARDRTVPGSIRLKAYVGWVKALKGNQQNAEAIALCKKLARHPQAQIKQWANNTLVELTQSVPQGPLQKPPTVDDLSGFRPLTAADSSTPEIAAPPAEHPSKAQASANPPELQPLDTDPIKPEFNNPATDGSATAGKTPPDDPSTSSSTPTAAVSPAINDAPSVPKAGAMAASNSAIEATSSLFHYEALNQQPLASDAPQQSEAETPLRTGTHSARPSSVLTLQAGERLERPQKLANRPAWLWQAWVSQVLGAIAVFWLCRAFVQLTATLIATILTPFSRFLPLPLGWRYYDYSAIVFLVLVSLLLASPWLLDWLLQTTAGLKPLSVQTLQKTHPEGCRSLRRISQTQGWLMPLLQTLPVAAPLIFSYGWVPRYSRVVVTQGLLERLTDDELATLICYEMAHMRNRTLPWMSLVTVLLQFCHLGYWQAARWGDRCTQPIYRLVAAAISAFCYGWFWLFRKVNVLAARSRVLVSDYQATVWTGNPNALMRALVKLEVGLAETIRQTGYTPPLIESTDLFTPVGYETAIGLGSLFPDPSFLAAIAWDIHNPYRRWLSLNSSHVGLGERLKELTGYALKWRLTPTFPLPDWVDSRKTSPRFGTNWGAFLTQVSPYIGPFVGVAVAMLLWFLGGIFEPLGVWRVGWIYGDRSVLWGSLLLGLGMGIMIRINPYFPDITAGNRLQNPSLPSLYDDPMLLPTVSQPLRLTGKLLGRPGMANWLCQDLILQTSTGLIKLHFLSALGAAGNLLNHPRHPSERLGQQLEVQGWYRRGAIAWLDTEAFFQHRKLVAKANPPLWSVTLSLACCAAGLVILVRG